MFCQFRTQQLVSMLSDIIRRDPAAANQSPVSSAAPLMSLKWWSKRDALYMCWHHLRYNFLNHPVNLCHKKKEQLIHWLPDSQALSLFFCLLLLVMSTSVSRDSFTTWRGGGPAWNNYYIVTFNPSASAFLLQPDSVQILILKCRSEFWLPIVIVLKRNATKHFKSSWVQTDLISWSSQTNGCAGCWRHASKTSSYQDNGKNTPWGVRH